MKDLIYYLFVSYGIYIIISFLFYPLLTMKTKLKTTIMKTLIKLVLFLLLFYALINLIGCATPKQTARYDTIKNRFNPKYIGVTHYSVADRYKNY